MWPAKWIRDDAQLQALLAKWRGLSGTRTEIWEYSCSHNRLLIRMIHREAGSPLGPIEDGYLYCHACQNVQFEPGWHGVNIEVAKQTNASKTVYVVTDGNRLKVVCGSVGAIEPPVGPWIHLSDELKCLSFSESQPVKKLSIEYVMVLVNGKTPEETTRLVEKIAAISIQHKGMISDILRELVIVAFGDIIHNSPMRDKRLALVEHLNRELPGSLKIIHGATEVNDGKFDAMLRRLGTLGLGQVEEFEK